jgi:hypothetical protein
VAPWPIDLAEYSKVQEKAWAGIDELIKMGIVKDFGWFLDGTSGYAIGEGESITTFRNVSMFLPYWESEVQEIIPYEKGKENLRAIMKAQIEAAKK